MKNRYEFTVKYRRKPDGDILTRTTKFYTNTYEQAVARVKMNTKYLVSYQLNEFTPETLDKDEEGRESLECVICSKPKLEFSRFCKEHYMVINGDQDILLVNRNSS